MAILSNEPASKSPTVTRSTSRAELDATIESNRQKVSRNPGDGAAAVQLADALMRAARVKGDASLAIEAEHVLRATLQHSSSDYLARRMLSVVYLSQHRFAEALTEAKAAQTLRPKDAWNYAIAGDALLELGRYEEAFDSFDQVMEHRPDAGAYARVAYARELQGDLDGARAPDADVSQRRRAGRTSKAWPGRMRRLGISTCSRVDLTTPSASSITPISSSRRIPMR